MIDDTTIDVLKIFVDRGIVPRNILRNILIKRDYEQMKVEGVRSEDAFESLGQKHFLSAKAIQAIVYVKDKKQDAPDN